MSAALDDIQQQLTTIFTQALNALQQTGELPIDIVPALQFMRSKDPAHGDFACNVALMLAKQVGKNPRTLAAAIQAQLPHNALVAKTEVAGAGFINIFLDNSAKFSLLSTILAQGEEFGISTINAGKRVQIEFVSANPTSALHVGHGRGAAYGATLANLLQATGYEVVREYYVNDAGRQMDILATSTVIRYLQLLGEPIVFPSNGYQGAYINDIAQSVYDEHGAMYHVPWHALIAKACQDALYDEEGVLVAGDKEQHIDDLIAKAKALLGAGYEVFHEQAAKSILTDIKADLADFGVNFDVWFSEKSLQAQIDKDIAILQDKGLLYEKDGNLWFKSTQFGDEKDRVVKRSNGQITYFASDIAYHKNKFDRGFDSVINIWGADHHGYIARIKAALAALDIDPARLEVVLVQFVSLYRGTEKVQMSSRSGQFITLRELRAEVGNDAARYYYVSRTPNVPMDFDLALAKSQSRDNAVYYIQYAHARICSVLERLQQFGVAQDDTLSQAHLSLLDNDGENALIKRLAAYSDTLIKAATTREPNLVCNYLKDLAGDFHTYYNDNRILPTGLADNTATQAQLAQMQARLYLLKAVRQVLANGLSLLGLSVPTSM